MKNVTITKKMLNQMQARVNPQPKYDTVITVTQYLGGLDVTGQPAVKTVKYFHTKE